MTAGLRGTFVLSSTQTEVDGLRPNGPGGLETLVVGAFWRWTGQITCLDAPSDLLLLGGALGEAEVRKRAGRRVRKMFGSMVGNAVDGDPRDAPWGTEGVFVITDGCDTYSAAIIGLSDNRWYFVFTDRVPNADRDFRIVAVTRPAKTERRTRPVGSTGMVCFAPGTQIATPQGMRPVEGISPGDRVETRDDGPQPVIWAGHTDISAAQMTAGPDQRAIWVAPGAYGSDTFGGGVVLSPDHRILLEGAVARVLFNTDEVLVPAVQLIDDAKLRRMPLRRNQRYYHLMLERHQVIWANGLACESFHPGDADLLALENQQRLAFIEVAPDAFRDVSQYGGHARRCLSGAETAIMRHAI